MDDIAAGDFTDLLTRVESRFEPKGQLLHAAQTAYAKLTAQIRNDGFTLESYTLPFIYDERAVQTSVLQRITAIIDITKVLAILVHRAINCWICLFCSVFSS